MATIRNSTPFNLFCGVLNRSLESGEIVDNLTDEVAGEACRTGVFELGVLVAPDEVAADKEETPESKRGPGRPRSVRGSIEVEEVVDDERETR